MPEPILISDISPERLARWKRRYPVHWHEILQVFHDDALIRRGGADWEFRRKACDRVLRLCIELYDMACPTDKHKQDLRRRFRLLLREYPSIDLFNRGFQQRLSEHEGWVAQGMEEPDPDEIEGGCDA